MFQKKSFSEKINKIKNISVKDYMLNYSHSGIHTFAAYLLLLFCIFPIIYNMFYNIYDTINFPYAEASMQQIYEYIHTWHRIIVVFGVIMIFLVMYQILSLHYRTNIKEIFSFSWIKDRWLPFCLFLLLIWSFFSAIASSNPIRGFLGDHYRKDGVVTFCVFGLIFLTSFLPSENQIKTICEVLVIFGATTGFMVALGVNNAQWFFFNTENIRTSIFVNSNHYGWFLSICIPLLIGLMIRDDSTSIWVKILRVAEFWLLINAILVSNCRGGFIAIIVALIGWNIYVFWLCRSRWKQVVIIDALFIVIIAVLNTDNGILRRILNLGPELHDAIHGGEDELAVLGTNRLVLWRMGLEYSFDKPIFGYGPDNLLFIMKHETNDKPHNELIEIAASLGWPALIFYLSGMIGQIVLFFKNIKKVSMLEVIVFSSVCSYFVSSMFGNVMFYTTPYFYMMLGFSYILLRRTPDVTPLFNFKRKKKEPVENIADEVTAENA